MQILVNVFLAFFIKSVFFCNHYIFSCSHTIFFFVFVSGHGGLLSFNGNCLVYRRRIRNVLVKSAAFLENEKWFQNVFFSFFCWGIEFLLHLKYFSSNEKVFERKTKRKCVCSSSAAITFLVKKARYSDGIAAAKRIYNTVCCRLFIFGIPKSNRWNVFFFANVC